MAESTTPHKISWVGASPRPDCDTPNTTAIATSAPITLPTDIAKTPTDANAARNNRPCLGHGPADHGDQEDTWQPDPPDDDAGHGFVRMPRQLFDDDVPH